DIESQPLDELKRNASESGNAMPLWLLFHKRLYDTQLRMGRIAKGATFELHLRAAAHLGHTLEIIPKYAKNGLMPWADITAPLLASISVQNVQDVFLLQLMAGITDPHSSNIMVDFTRDGRLRARVMDTEF